MGSLENASDSVILSIFRSRLYGFSSVEKCCACARRIDFNGNFDIQEGEVLLCTCAVRIFMPLTHCFLEICMAGLVSSMINIL